MGPLDVTASPALWQLVRRQASALPFDARGHCTMCHVFVIVGQVPYGERADQRSEEGSS